jgi:hypothetical protein
MTETEVRVEIFEVVGKLLDESGILKHVNRELRTQGKAYHEDDGTVVIELRMKLV